MVGYNLSHEPGLEQAVSVDVGDGSLHRAIAHLLQRCEFLGR